MSIVSSANIDRLVRYIKIVTGPSKLNLTRKISALTGQNDGLKAQLESLTVERAATIERLMANDRDRVDQILALAASYKQLVEARSADAQASFNEHRRVTANAARLAERLSDLHRACVKLIAEKERLGAAGSSSSNSTDCHLT